jgi:hypothetical protein
MPETLCHVERPSIAGTLIRLAALLPAFGLAVVPAAMLVAAGPATLTVAEAQPAGALLLAIGLASLGLLALVPMVKLFARLGYERSVEASARGVHVRERSWLGRQDETMPLATFDGLVHVVRTSLSGSRHELVLVDRQRGRHVVVHAAERIGRETIDGVVARLGLPELQAIDLLKRRPLLGIVAPPVARDRGVGEVRLAA